MARQEQIKTDYRGIRRQLARGVSPNPLLRLATLLLASGLVGSMLVLASSIIWLHRSDRSEMAPVRADIVEIVEPRERDIFEDIAQIIGEQEIDKEPEDEETKVEQVDEPDVSGEPSEVVADIEKPPGPAEEEQESEQVAVIATDRGTGGPQALYSSRSGQDREDALGKYGGGEDTENAVAAGLDWLARHQNAEGNWNHARYIRHCRDQHAKCESGLFNFPSVHAVPLDPGLTGLALLAFAGSNHTHMRDGPYRENVAKAVEWLLGHQTDSGRIGDYPPQANYYMMYNHGIATLALAELYVMTGDQRLRQPVKKAVAFIARAQQRSGAWDYTDAQTGRYDTSVTGWQVMALKAANNSGIQAPPRTLFLLADFLDRVTQRSGEVYYSNQNPAPGARGEGMVAVGLLSQQFLGFPNDRRTARRQTEIILGNPPQWGRMTLRDRGHSIYYWYHATLAMFQVGDDAWAQWNPQMKEALLSQQRQGGCADGSWDVPNNQWARTGGRVYVTALNILCLEVYYRYLPLYDGGALDTVGALIATVEHGSRGDAARAVRLLGQFDTEPARKFLTTLAHKDDHALALEASIALAERSELASIVPLLRQLQSKEPYERFQALGALAPMIGQGLAPHFIEALRDESEMVARRASRTLRQYAKQSFGFEPGANREEREAAIRNWEEWWENYRQGEPTESSEPWLVIGVYPDSNAVAFSTGRPEQATIGDELVIYRDGDYVARVRVAAAESDLCVATVLEQTESGGIREGDVVKPRN